MRLSAFPVAVLVTASVPALAQPTPQLVVGFVSATAQPVPSLSVAGLLLLMVAISVLVWKTRRLGWPATLGAWLLGAVVLAAGGLTGGEAVVAQTVSRTLSLGQTSPASLPLSGTAAVDVAVTNASGGAVRLASIDLADATGSGYFISTFGDAAQRCASGQTLQAGQGCVVRVAAGGQYLQAQVGDVLKVRLGELRPTQPSVGYDQVYYHLGRKQPDLTRFTATQAGYLGDDATDNYSRYLYRTERKRADDYCADNGRGAIDDARYVPGQVSLVAGTGFACTVPESGPIAAAGLKTVVVGPEGQLYLTDGHHTFTTLWELADGGANLPVWVRVSGNFSNAADSATFWQRMQATKNVWLRDAQGNAITPDQLPQRLGLDQMGDDSYRSLVYLTRGMGYDNGSLPEFAEFYWGNWLRGQVTLSNYVLNGAGNSANWVAALKRARIELSGGAPVARSGDATNSYVAAVRDASIRMVALAPGAPVDGGMTAQDLGKLGNPAAAKPWNDLMEEDIWRTDLNSSNLYRTAGKAYYALMYRQCGGAASTQPACWKDQRIQAN